MSAPIKSEFAGGDECCLGCLTYSKNIFKEPQIPLDVRKTYSDLLNKDVRNVFINF